MPPASLFRNELHLIERRNVADRFGKTSCGGILEVETHPEPTAIGARCSSSYNPTMHGKVTFDR